MSRPPARWRPRPRAVVARSLISCPINPRATKVPVDLDGFCHVQRTIRARSFLQGFEQVQQVSPFSTLDAFFTPSNCEFSSSRFASRCTCALNIPQSAHTCESICSQIISATPTPSQPSRRANLPLFNPMANTMSWDASSKYIRC
jgi:hypothetical protein